MGCLFAKLTTNRSVYDMNPVMKSPVIFVSGVPGAGYNTVSHTLAAITGYHVINPGKLVRAEAANITTLRGMKLAKMLSENKVPEEIVVDLVKESMLQNVDAKGFILCGFPKNKKMANIYRREVKMPEKVISLQVADEIATMRLQQKLTELGRSDVEVKEAEDIVKSAAPKIRKVTERFRKESVITVNSSKGNVEALNESLHTATESLKELLNKKKTTEGFDLSKRDGEDFKNVDLSCSAESSQQVSSQSSEIIKPIEEQNIQHIESDTDVRNLQSDLSQDVSPLDEICEQDTHSEVSSDDSKEQLSALKITADVHNIKIYELSSGAESSHGVTQSESYNRLGKTIESTDLLNIQESILTNDVAQSNQSEESFCKNEYFLSDAVFSRISPGVNQDHVNMEYAIGMNIAEPFEGKLTKNDHQCISTSAEMACMRDHMKVLTISENNETCQ